MTAVVAGQEVRQIFILDDEPAVRTLIRTCMPHPSPEVLEFGDVETAAAALERTTPDLIFLDLELGGSDAIEAFRRFAEKGYAGAVQLISGRGQSVLEGVQVIGARYGFRLLPPIEKPFRIRQIKRVVEELQATPATGPAGRSDTALARAPMQQVTLDEALDSGWLELWYQPKVNLRTSKTVGAEGLIRARHPEAGVLPPIAFLAGAGDEAHARLTELVVMTALRDWSHFQEAGYPLELAVNVPSSAFLTVPIASMVRDHRPRSSTWPGLVVEITEDQHLEEVPAAQEVAAQLGIYSVRLALDDFGQGYSSLARFRDLPFASLKIDRSFVTNCTVSPAKLSMCRSMIDMAHSLGRNVVAEGIETESDLNTLIELGCDFGQGYLLGRPTPKETLIERLVAVAA